MKTNLLLVLLFGLFLSPCYAQRFVNSVGQFENVEARGVDQALGSLTWFITHDVFADASPQSPVYLRLRLEDGVRLSRTLVDVIGSDQGHDPIYLAAKIPRVPGEQGIAQANIDPQAIGIVRWIAGESDIWLAVTDSSSDWVLLNDFPRPPTRNYKVSFSLGEGIEINTHTYAKPFEEGRANRPYIARNDGNALDLAIHADLSQSTLHLGNVIGLDTIEFPNAQGITNLGPDQIVPGEESSSVFRDNILGYLAPAEKSWYFPLLPDVQNYAIRLHLRNMSETSVAVGLSAYDQNGQEYRVTVDVGAGDGVEPLMGDLFPNLAGAFAIRINQPHIIALLTLTHREQGSVQYLRPLSDLHNRLVLRTEHTASHPPTIALFNPSDQAAALRAVLFDRNGDAGIPIDLGVLEPQTPTLFTLELPGLSIGTYNVVVEGDDMIGTGISGLDSAQPRFNYGHAVSTAIDDLLFPAASQESPTESKRD